MSAVSPVASSPAPAPRTAPAPAEPAPSKRISAARSGASLLQAETPAPAPAAEKGLFGFGRKNRESAPPAPVVSNSLFPAAPSQAHAPSATPPQPVSTEVSLPRASGSEHLKKFSLPKLGGSPAVAAPQQANAYYTVVSNAQFMKRSADQSRTTITALPPGTVVMMTKPGSDWAGVQLPDGSTGTIEAKHLRAAAGTEATSFNR